MEDMKIERRESKVPMEPYYGRKRKFVHE